ncbi:IMH1 [Candida pseudojiufengensis]|uniref:IMH1 n=1 Tax=Candida pseudojiufengensis TaxID=497109 RepID=UPI002224B6F1|nr:IMH1 [Candida pseudojiufengensis]KAI5963693.1 IMH1 [Candida pseudojiufengensis]
MFSKIRNFSEDVAKSLNDLNLSDQQLQQQQKPDPLVQLQRNSKLLSTETPDSSELIQPTNDSEVPSRITTPAPTPINRSNSNIARGSSPNLNDSTSVPKASDDLDNLSPVIKSKLKKFAKYEEKYPILLDAYKIEKRKTELIKIFENVLKENTPISTISDAKILVEYLNGLNDKNKLQNNEIRKLTKDNSVLTFKVAKYEGDGEDSMFKRMEDLKKENESLRSQISDNRKEFDEYKIDFENRIKEKDETIEKLKSAEKGGSEEKIDGENDDLASQISALRKEVEMKEEELIDSNHKINNANKEISDKNEEIEELRDSVKEIGNDLVSAKDEIKNLKNKNAENGSNGTHSKDEKDNTVNIDTLNLQITTLKKEVNEWKDKNKLKTEKLKELNNKISTLEDENNKNTLSSKQSEKNLRKDILLFKTQIKELESKVENAEKEIDDHKSERSKLEERISDLSKFKSNDTSYKLEISSLQSSLKHKDEVLKELKIKLDQVMEENKSLNQKIDRLTTSNNDLQSNSMEYLKSKNELLTKQELLIENEKNLVTQVSKLQQEKQQIKTELTRTKNKLDSTLNEQSGASNDLLTYKRQHDEISMKMKEYKLRIESLEDDISESRNLLQEKNRESSSLRRLLVDADEVRKQKESNYKLEVSRIQDEKLEFERSTSVLVKRKQREIDELKKDLEEYKDKVSNAESKLKELETTNTSQASGSLNANTPDVQINSDLQSQITTLRTALSSSSSKLKDLERLNMNLKKLNEDHILKFERLSKNYKLLTQQYRLMKDHREQEQSQTSSATSSRNGSILDVDVVNQDNNINKQENANVAYLKNVLLGYFEHKEQRDQLLPVLKTIFQFSKDDENKFLLALK